MIAIGGDRTLLARVFARGVSPLADGIVASSWSQLPNTEIVAVFADNALTGDLPHTIVVDTPTMREFFAWAATYLNHWSPITSVVRVIRRSESSPFPCVAPNTQQLSGQVVRALASLIIGEALFEWRLAGEKSTPNILSLRSTFGYAAVEALYTERLDVATLFGAWERAQTILHLPARRIERRSFLGVWQPIVSLLQGTTGAAEQAGRLDQALAEMMSERRLPLGRLPGGTPLFADSGAVSASERREDAVVGLEEWLARRHLNTPFERFLTACLAARLSHGAITHFDVVAGMTRDEPESLLWYSFISGLLATEPSSQVVERLLFRLAVELGPDVQHRRGDVSLDELEVLIQPDGIVAPWVGIGAGYINVELETGVCSCFRVRDRATSLVPKRQVSAAGDRDAQGFEDLLQQLRSLYYDKGRAPQRKRRRG